MPRSLKVPCSPALGLSSVPLPHKHLYNCNSEGTHQDAEGLLLVLQRLPGLLAATGMLLLLIMSLIALWPPTNGAHAVPRVQANLDQASLPQKIFNK